MPLEVRSEVAGGFGDAGTDDEPEPGILQRIQFSGREHAGVGDNHRIIDLLRVLNCLRT